MFFFSFILFIFFVLLHVYIVLLADRTDDGQRLKSDVRTLILVFSPIKTVRRRPSRRNVSRKTLMIRRKNFLLLPRSISAGKGNDVTYRVRLKNKNGAIDISNIYPLFRRTYNDVTDDTTTVTTVGVDTETISCLHRRICQCRIRKIA